MPQQDADASEVNEALEVLGVSLPAGDEPAEVVEPREESFDLPTADIATQLATILGSVFPVRSIGRDHLDLALFPEAAIQAVTVVRFVTNQPIGGDREKPGVDRLVHERDFSW